MLEHLTPQIVQPPCKVTLIRETLTPEDQKLFDSYLADFTTWSPNKLSLALRGQNILVSADTIRRYRVRRNLC
jgi:hypothetical protein